MTKDSPFYDQSTGLYSNHSFQMLLIQEIKRTNRSGDTFSIAYIQVQNSAGHPGDKQLAATCARTLKENIREWDYCGRLTENTYGVVFIGTEAELAGPICERLFSAFSRENGSISVSVGLASFPADGVSEKELTDCATSCVNEAMDPQQQKSIVYRKHKQPTDDADSQSILLVDDDVKNIKIMNSLLSTEGFPTISTYSGEEALDIIQRSSDIGLILLDVMMPGMSGFEVCRRIKSSHATRLIPIILLTALDDRESRIRGIQVGADDFITKPPAHEELLARVKSLLKVKKLNNRLASIEDVLISFAKAVEAKDRYTMGHVDRVAGISVSLGTRLDLSDREIWALRIGGALHDVGKIGIDGQILNKIGPLTDEEWIKMRDHPIIGYEICRPLKANLGDALDIIRHHHEKLDGSGYPDGLSGDEVPVVARIMAVADIYDALVTDRPYRSGLSSEDALAILRQEADEAKLDRRVVASLVDLMTKTTDDVFEMEPIS